MSSAITAINGSATAAAGARSSPSATSGSELVASKETFLKLLVAQLKNQDPMKPLDGMEFVGQLAQFSQLEQLMGIRGDLAAAANVQNAVAAANAGTVNP